MHRLLAAVALLALVSCDAPDPNAPADGAAIKDPPVDTNPSAKTGTGGDMTVTPDGGADTALQGKTQ